MFAAQLERADTSILVKRQESRNSKQLAGVAFAGPAGFVIGGLIGALLGNEIKPE